jgi:hypothetical protein
VKGYLHPQPSLFRGLPYRLSCIGMHMQQGTIQRPSGYPEAQWIFNVEGEGVLRCGDREWRIGKDTAFFLPADLAHSYKPITETWLTHFIAFSGWGVPELLKCANWTDVSVNYLNSDPSFGLSTHSRLLYKMSLALHKVVSLSKKEYSENEFSR